MSTEFFEEDEPVETVVATFDSGEKSVTSKPAFSPELNEIFQKAVDDGIIIVGRFTDELRDFNFKNIKEI